uniref:Uncharacterized protein n=1 Tax=Arundo donax TaxID=35708 RepID=A0A0A9C253_ARUDO
MTEVITPAKAPAISQSK